MNIPSDLFYSKDHEWLKIEGNTAKVGITDFAQGELGDIVFVDIPSVGETLNAGDVFGSIEAVKTVSDLFLPVSGTILSINPEIESSPDLINSDPYGRGWIVEIELSDNANTGDLLSADSYKELVS